jgi:ABC-type Na+ efflux pump permease subunit
MKQLTIFRVITFILVPIAALFGLMALFMIPIALANPGLLLNVFVLAAFVIYTFSSLRFLTKGIDPGRPCKPKLKDWIRVNAFVSMFMCIMFLQSAITFFGKSKAELKEELQKSLEMLTNVPPMLNANLMVEMMKIVTWFTVIISIILLVHIFINFKLMKTYKYLFDEPVA